MTRLAVSLAPGDRVYVAGHRGLVGSAVVRALTGAGHGTNLVLRTRDEVDLRDAAAVDALFASERPDHVVLAAAKVGGILANSRYPADFIRENLAIELNVMDAAFRHGARRLVFLGSSCIYPKLAPQPLREEYLLTGPLEPTNEAYALAKIAGIGLYRAYNAQHGTRYVGLMPTNMYGPGDNYDLETSHVLAAFIRKFHEAKVSGADHVVVWGSGTPRREFMHVDDLADAVLFVMRAGDELPHDLLNVGVGEDLSIRELAELVGEVVGFDGHLEFDGSKPDGTPRKLLDVSRMTGSGWTATIALRDGIRRTYQDFVRTRGPEAPSSDLARAPAGDG